MSEATPAWEARKLLRAARVGTLASVMDSQPFASLITPACAPDLSVLLLLSDLSEHTRHLRADPRCSVLVAGAPEGANPQTAPRVTVTGLAEVAADPALKSRYLAVHPYAGLYAGFQRFLDLADPAAGWAVCWRLRPGRPAARRRSDAGRCCRCGHCSCGSRHHEPLQCGPSRRIGGDCRSAWGMADGGGRCRRLRPGERGTGGPHPLVGTSG